MSNGSHCVAVNGKIYEPRGVVYSHPVAGANGFATTARIITADIVKAAHCECIVVVRREERSSQAVACHLVIANRVGMADGQSGFDFPPPTRVT